MIENKGHPPLNESRLLWSRAAQPVFPYGKRTGNSQHGFARDEQNGGEMQHAKLKIAYPAPAKQRANPYGKQPAYDEQYEQKMDNKNSIGEERHAVCCAVS